MTPLRALLNQAVRRDGAYRGLFSEGDYLAVDRFYDSQPTLQPTPLLDYSRLAESLEIGALMVKDETARFGLPAFKTLGARYAMERLGRHALRAGVVCATAGNHGRAVARAAADMAVKCTVFVPAISGEAGVDERRVREARIAGMHADNAHVIDVAGTYEEAVEMAAARARTDGSTVVSDTGWPGYEEIPRDIMAGYTRLVTEASQQWRASPDVGTGSGRRRRAGLCRCKLVCIHERTNTSVSDRLRTGWSRLLTRVGARRCAHSTRIGPHVDGRTTLRDAFSRGLARHP